MLKKFHTFNSHDVPFSRYLVLAQIDGPFYYLNVDYFAAFFGFFGVCNFFIGSKKFQIDFQSTVAPSA